MHLREHVKPVHWMFGDNADAGVLTCDHNVAPIALGVKLNTPYCFGVFAGVVQYWTVSSSRSFIKA
ncbi:MAG: hypothetical protein WA970_13845 [Gammaproteobacteria bacterium]